MSRLIIGMLFLLGIMGIGEPLYAGEGAKEVYVYLDESSSLVSRSGESPHVEVVKMLDNLISQPSSVLFDSHAQVKVFRFSSEIQTIGMPFAVNQRDRWDYIKNEYGRLATNFTNMEGLVNKILGEARILPTYGKVFIVVSDFLHDPKNEPCKFQEWSDKAVKVIEPEINTYRETTTLPSQGYVWFILVNIDYKKLKIQKDYQCYYDAQSQPKLLQTMLSGLNAPDKRIRASRIDFQLNSSAGDVVKGLVAPVEITGSVDRQRSGYSLLGVPSGVNMNVKNHNFFPVQLKDMELLVKEPDEFHMRICKEKIISLGGSESKQDIACEIKKEFRGNFAASEKIYVSLSQEPSSGNGKLLTSLSNVHLKTEMPGIDKSKFFRWYDKTSKNVIVVWYDSQATGKVVARIEAKGMNPVQLNGTFDNSKKIFKIINNDDNVFMNLDEATLYLTMQNDAQFRGKEPENITLKVSPSKNMLSLASLHPKRAVNIVIVLFPLALLFVFLMVKVFFALFSTNALAMPDYKWISSSFVVGAAPEILYILDYSFIEIITFPIIQILIFIASAMVIYPVFRKIKCNCAAGTKASVVIFYDNIEFILRYVGPIIVGSLWTYLVTQGIDSLFDGLI